MGTGEVVAEDTAEVGAGGTEAAVGARGVVAEVTTEVGAGEA